MPSIRLGTFYLNCQQLKILYDFTALAWHRKLLPQASREGCGIVVRAAHNQNLLLDSEIH